MEKCADDMLGKPSKRSGLRPANWQCVLIPVKTAGTDRPSLVKGKVINLSPAVLKVSLPAQLPGTEYLIRVNVIYAGYDRELLARVHVVRNIFQTSDFQAELKVLKSSPEDREFLSQYAKDQI